MTWRWAASILVLCTAGMSFSARVPESGATCRWLFVCSAIGAAWASWCIAQSREISLMHVIVLAVLCRLLVFPMLPTLSDDGFRYIWDGRLVAQFGISPYAHLPSDPDLAIHHSEPIFYGLNSPKYFSVYPPVSQAVFALGGWAYTVGWKASWYAIKGGFVVLEAIGILLLARMVRARQVALYALHPIAVVEIAGQGHTEGALIGFLGIALWSLSRSPFRAGFALSIAGWVKIYPLALAALIGRRWCVWVGWGLGTVLGAYALSGSQGWTNLFQSLALYGGTLDFYAAPFLIFKSLLFPALSEHAGRWSALVLSILWGGTLVALVLTRDGSVPSFRHGLALAVIANAVLSPMQHPWNWVGALFVLPLLQNSTWLWWIVTLSLPTYLRYVSHDWVYIAAILIGWGGGALLTLRAYWFSTPRWRLFNTESTVADPASSH